MVWRKPRAGIYAQKQYKEGLRKWRRANRWRFNGVCMPFVLAGVLVGMVEGNVVAWGAGLVSGGVLAIWIAIRDEGPPEIERWREGSEGERRTEKTLRPLERKGWQFFHDVQRSHGNYDHIALGSGGAYLLETKKLRGVIEIRDGIPHRTSRHIATRQQALSQIPRQAKSAAASLKEEIERRTGTCPWVQAVVVFWSDFPDGVVKGDRCFYVHGSRIRAWLESQPTDFTEAQVDEIARGIEAITAEEPAVEQAQGPLDLARA